MNPTDNSGSFSGQSQNVNAGLTQVQAAAAASQQAPAAAPVQEQESVLQATLQQLANLSRQYAADPFEQTREIERLKAAYLYREFGRTLKGSDN